MILKNSFTGTICWCQLQMFSRVDDRNEWMLKLSLLRGRQSCVSPMSPPTVLLCFPDCLTEVTALNLFTGREVPLLISRKNAFDGYLDTVIGECSIVDVMWTRGQSKGVGGSKTSRRGLGRGLFFPWDQLCLLMWFFCVTGVPECSEEDLSVAKALNLSWTTVLETHENGTQTLINSDKVHTEDDSIFYLTHDFCLLNLNLGVNPVPCV